MRFPQRLARIHRELARCSLATCRPDCVAIENLFHATNVRSALKLGHARGVAMLAAVEAGCDGGRSTRRPRSSGPSSATAAPRSTRCSRWSSCCSGWTSAPSPHDAADALAVAICHLHSAPLAGLGRGRVGCREPGIAAAGRETGRAAAALAGGSTVRPRTDDRVPSRPRCSTSSRTASSSTCRASATTCTCRCPPTTTSASDGAEVALRVYTHVREDALQLYGFLTELERQLFERLDRHQRHRPEAGDRACCRAWSRATWWRAVQRGDVARLTGDSRRRQEDGRAHRARAEGSARASSGRCAGSRDARGQRRRIGCASDLLSALQNLGYHRPLAEKAVEAARRRRTRRHCRHLRAACSRARSGS